MLLPFSYSLTQLLPSFLSRFGVDRVDHRQASRISSSAMLLPSFLSLGCFLQMTTAHLVHTKPREEGS